MLASANFKSPVFVIIVSTPLTISEGSIFMSGGFAALKISFLSAAICSMLAFAVSPTRAMRWSNSIISFVTAPRENESPKAASFAPVPEMALSILFMAPSVLSANFPLSVPAFFIFSENPSLRDNQTPVLISAITSLRAYACKLIRLCYARTIIRSNKSSSPFHNQCREAPLKFPRPFRQRGRGFRQGLSVPLRLRR
jgi:hypothetical protein